MHSEMTLCFRRARRAIGRPAGRPYNGTTLLLGERRICPPDPSNELRLMVFSRNVLVFRPGNA